MKKRKEAEVLQQIGENIRRVRLEKKMTQSTLARLSEIGSANLSRAEAGQNNMTVTTLLRISEAMGVHISDLLRY